METLKHGRSRRGIVVIEAALILPLVMLLLLGLLEYCWIFIKSEQINNASRHGCRIGVVDGANAANVTAAVTVLMNNANMSAGTSSYVLDMLDSTGASVDPATLLVGETLTVRITVPYANVHLLGIPLIPVPTNLDGEVTMVREGQ